MPTGKVNLKLKLKFFAAHEGNNTVTTEKFLKYHLLVTSKIITLQFSLTTAQQ